MGTGRFLISERAWRESFLEKETALSLAMASDAAKDEEIV
jgi:hypothetical protein